MRFRAVPNPAYGGGMKSALALGVLLLCSAALAAEPQRVLVLQKGEFTADGGSERLPRPPGSTGITYRGEFSNLQFLRATNQVEARLCAIFGVTIAVFGPGAAQTLPVTIRKTHPRLVRPDGRSGTIDTDEAVFSSGFYNLVYRLDEPWEAVPGTWTFSVMSGGKVLAEESIEVVPPGDGQPGKAGRCAAPTS